VSEKQNRSDGFSVVRISPQIAVLEICNSFLNTGHLRSVMLLAGLGLALAMLGPGVSSLDARLFGRKRIDITPH
jgi:hypothetical protein